MKLKELLYEALIAEVSIDQLKQQFVDAGKIDDKTFQEVVDASGGKGAYATWLLKKVTTPEDIARKKNLATIKAEDIYKYKKYLNVFHRRKREFPFQDINRVKSPSDLQEFIAKAVQLANAESEDPSAQKGVSKSDKYAEFKIGNVEGYDVYKIPKGRKDLYGASCELGSGTEWCTATGNTRNHFDDYIEDGPLYIFVKGDDKYQFHFESGQFMDKDDNPIL